MAPSTTPQRSSGRWEFDSARLAVALSDGCRRLGLSTRDLARRAGISQPYVVALQRASGTSERTGPTPTVDVLARLAHALHLEPTQLLAASLRRAGRHALLVIEDHERSPLDHARHACRRGGHDVDTWIWAASEHTQRSTDASDHDIDLRRDTRRAYEPALVAAALQHELGCLAGDLAGRELGLVFAETSAVMATLDDPNTIISFEHRWAEVVSDAASAVDAHAAWNVCVYELAALQALRDPVTAALDLMRSHDTIWAARDHRLSTGAAGARRVLSLMRPAGLTRSSWRATTDGLVAELDLDLVAERTLPRTTSGRC